MDHEIAAAGTEQKNDDMENMYLDFRVENEIYGIEIRYVLQIIGMQKITELPDMPPGMKGFINLRGNVIPVLSMRERFGKTEDAYTSRTCIVVVRRGERETGLIVDAIEETVTIEPDRISPPPSIAERGNKTYIMGIARLPGEHTAILLDTEKLLSDDIC